jgi:hypothetical protein
MEEHCTAGPAVSATALGLFPSILHRRCGLASPAIKQKQARIERAGLTKRFWSRRISG